MSDIRPFCAVRPNEAFASKIAALPYDVYTRKEAKKDKKSKIHLFTSK